MAKTERKREFATGRVAQDRGARDGQLESKARSRPTRDRFDEELFVRGESFGVEDWRVLVEARHLLGHPMNTDDHRRRNVDRFEEPTPLRKLLTVTCEYDRLGWIRRYVHRDLAAPVVVRQCLRDERACFRFVISRLRWRPRASWRFSHTSIHV